MKKLILALTLGALAAGGCAGHSMLRDAEAKFAQAKASGAEKAAPYEFELSRQYLDMARHETDEGDSAGQTYSRKSMDYADAAMNKAKGGGK